MRAALEEDGFAFMGARYTHAFAPGDELRGTDEGSLAPALRERHVARKALKLASVSVSLDGDIDNPERELSGGADDCIGKRARHQDRAGADAPEWNFFRALFQRLDHIEYSEKMEHRSALAARQDQAGGSGEIGGAGGLFLLGE